MADDFIVITDGNHLDYQSPDGQGYGLIPRDFAAEPFGTYAAYSAPLLTWTEIKERAEYRKATKTRNCDRLAAKGFHDSNQSRTNYCWMHGCVNGAHGTRITTNQQLVRLSAASAAAPANSFRNAGGYGVQALKWLQQYGVATMDLWPANEISRSLWTPEVKANALRTRVEEWEDMESRDYRALCSALVQDLLCPVAFNWWSHLICALDPEFEDASDTSPNLICINSHGQGKHILLTGRKAIADDAQVIRRVSIYGAN